MLREPFRFVDFIEGLLVSTKVEGYDVSMFSFLYRGGEILVLDIRIPIETRNLETFFLI